MLYATRYHQITKTILQEKVKFITAPQFGDHKFASSSHDHDGQSLEVNGLESAQLKETDRDLRVSSSTK